MEKNNLYPVVGVHIRSGLSPETLRTSLNPHNPTRHSSTRYILQEEVGEGNN